MPEMDLKIPREEFDSVIAAMLRQGHWNPRFLAMRKSIRQCAELYGQWETLGVKQRLRILKKVEAYTFELARAQEENQAISVRTVRL